MDVLHEAASSPRVAKKREVRVESLLEAASAILAKEGLEGLTLARVAHAMGWVPAALYRYVGSKDGLLAMMQRRAVADAHRGFGEAQAALASRVGRTAPVTVSLAALLAGADYYLDLPRTKPESWLLVAILLGDPRPLLSDEESRKTAPHLLAFLGDVQQLFERAAELGALAPGDATLRTLAFWASLQGALSLEKARRIAPGLPSGQTVGLASAKALLAGWGAEAPTLARAERLAVDGNGDRQEKGGRR